LNVNNGVLYVSSSRNIGIGTITPDRPLDIYSSTVVGIARIRGNNSNGVALTIQNDENAQGISIYAAGTSGFGLSGWAGNTVLESETGIVYSAYSGSHIFQNAARTERMRITSAGNVGIGTTSPGQLLEVVGGEIKAGRVDSSNEGGQVSFGRSTDNATAWYIDTYGNVASPQLRFVDVTGAAVRMTLTGSNVGIGTSSPAVKLQIDGTNGQERFRLNNNDSTAYTSFTEQEIRMWRQNDSGGAFQLATQAFSGTWTGGGGGILFSPLNTLRMTIGPTGNIGAPSGTNIFNASDIRLKQNISTTTYGLNTISLLNPVKFNWVNGFEPSEDGKDMLGFVAQEVLEVIPEAVESFGGDINLNGELIDNPLRVNEKFIIPVLVKAIQEQQAKITALEEILQRNNIQ
jgi:hypothetical protein